MLDFFVVFGFSLAWISDRVFVVGKEAAAGKKNPSGQAPAAVSASQKEAASASNAAQQALKNLQERGQKLNDLGDKTNELQDNASKFYEMAKAMRQKEENKKWYEL